MAINDIQYIDSDGIVRWKTLDSHPTTTSLSADITTLQLPPSGDYYTLLEQSTDPPSASEGSARFWLSDGTQKGNDGDVLYQSTAAGVTETGSLLWTDYSCSSITVSASDGTTGSASDVQTMFDGNYYQVEETNSDPGYNIIFEFSVLDRHPTLINTRWLYDGSSSHYVTWQLYNYNTLTWDQLRVFSHTNAYYSSMTTYLPHSVHGNYYNSGNMRLGVYHWGTGQTAHYFRVDYVGMSHSLQGLM